MSAIYKLSIQGIRSFDSNDRETIEFGKPLTLIVGSNGSGKTTIIECLKYATTGDLPPNSKGGAFVHDPKITGEKDIRAQVKLAFTSANGLNMIVTRNIQLLVKKTTTTFKTLEGQLVAINKEGDRSTLSTRALELDTQVPLYMGVPKAILEYVIFCHQEDSLWPLSEPSNLKKKFDEIFQAMKFTKALDNLKSIKKDMSVDIKLLKQNVEHLKVDRDRSKVTKLNINKLSSKYKEYQDQIKSIELQLRELTEQSDILFTSNQDFQKTLSHIENLKGTKSSTSDLINRLENSIEVMDLPESELKEILENFSENLKNKEIEVANLRKELENDKINIENAQRTADQLLSKKGALDSDKKSYERSIESLKEIETQAINNYHIKPIDPTNIGRFISDLVSVQTQENTAYQEYKNKYNEKITELNKDKASITELLAVQRQKLEYNLMDKDKIKKVVETLELDLSGSEFTDADLKNEKDSIDKYTSKFQQLEADDSVSKLSLKIKEKNNEMVLLESELENLQERIMKINQQSDLFAKLSLLKRSLAEKKKLLLDTENQFSQDPIAQSTNLVDSNDIGIDFNKSYINIQKSIALNNKDTNELNKKHTEASIRSTNLQNDMFSNKELIEKLTKHLEDTLPEDCPIEEYGDMLLESEQSYKTALENLKMHQTTLAFNKKALEIAENNNCCYLCSRAFDDESFKSSLLNQLKERTNDEFEVTLKETVESEKTFLDQLRKLEKDIITLNTAKDKLTELTSKSDEQRKVCDKFHDQLAEIEAKGNNLKESRDYFDTHLKSKVELITRLKTETRDLQAEVDMISDELKVFGGIENGVQTIEELQSKQRTYNDTLRTSRKEVVQLQEEREAKSNELSSLMNLIKERNIKISQIEASLRRRKSIEEDFRTKREEYSEIAGRIEKLNSEIIDLDNKLQKVLKDCKSVEDNFSRESTTKQEDVDSINRFIQQVDQYSSAIRNYESKGSTELDNCIRELSSVRNIIDSLKENVDSKNKSLTDQCRILNDSNNEKKNLLQNIELIGLKDKLSQIEEQISSFDIENAENERDKYQQESLKLRNMIEKFSSEKAGKLGEMKQLQNQIESLNQQLKIDYKNVDDNYHKGWVELQTKSFVTDDIDTYSRALDSAIMKYHGLKMQDINRIIDELWKKTYSGTDVDSIQIRSDEVGNSTKGKSYNYRVVMYKQDAELDMRGRCSAGQKVLASIIIRLALSETFGINCGVIALDEPTTNLDEENIESLAKSLNNIIQFRRNQKNFQLIVITHDEKFLNHMNAAQFTDHFFKVKRDERQKSLIEWVDINRVSE
ncbi:hypothetical protein Kpol_2000p34 [Vanderwaltozyma polyspora DSM 70294]|uniref:DNA repair protein RAD50 n=1 Tax=Vanderwaltozyma polyspora (strain ATCC 22028 / DSM 70294 / BCRC 21397 / CBS 2163 / NBRC 10782 / NRRL Y-8283 / UCD 57-17) TaxID=436907 RepID=A7TF44_VANPO|nr:uncharacterized protein Kpol_2000p34 [Vanderwaltozyma polyspora DSM 70294]EDO19069.1 hypothetical protein Kpol_2000p34 [Vanderwaltozyma polyspora DSM 70294]